MFNLFASSTVGTTIDNWTLSLWDFMSAFKESISLGFVKLFQKVFEAWNKSIIWAMEKLNKLNEIAQDFLVKIGAKSKIEGIISIGTDKGRLKAYKDIK